MKKTQNEIHANLPIFGWKFNALWNFVGDNNQNDNNDNDDKNNNCTNLNSEDLKQIRDSFDQETLACQKWLDDQKQKYNQPQ